MVVNAEVLVAKYIELRDKVTSISERQKEELKPYTQAMERVEKVFLDMLTELRSDSIKTGSGTAYKSTKRNVTVADRESFLEYIRSHDAWDMLTVQANKTAIEDFRTEHNDIPPGLNWREAVVVNIRRS